MSKSKSQKLIIIVDDHPIMRKGLALTLENELDSIRVELFHSAEDVISKLPALTPDLAIIDISLPGMSGLELIKYLNENQPAIKTLVLSRHDEMLYAKRVITAGADGYLMKVEAGEKLIKALQKILNGGIYVSDDVNEQLLHFYTKNNTSATTSPIDSLSDRELEVFECIGKGISTGHIAEKMHISVKTVDSYKSRIKQKLDINSSTDLLRHAVQWLEQ